MIGEEEIARIQSRLGELAVSAVGIDLDSFIEASDQVGSPQALAAGIDPRAVASAGSWAELARLLKPFRDHAVARLAAIRAELAEDGDLVPEEAACPDCGERSVDQLTIDDTDNVVCGSCGAKYPVAESGMVVCECSPADNPECAVGDHQDGHIVPATWRVVDPSEEDAFFKLCGPCCDSLSARAEASALAFERLADDEAAA